MSICPELYRSLPMLADIEKPRDWVIDQWKHQSKGPSCYDEYGCDRLGDTDNIWMSNTGFILLHETMHFPGLFYDIADYKAKIDTVYLEHTPHFSSNFFGLWPADGYGAYIAAKIKRYLPLDYGDSMLTTT